MEQVFFTVFSQSDTGRQTDKHACIDRHGFCKLKVDWLRFYSALNLLIAVGFASLYTKSQ